MNYQPGYIDEYGQFIPMQQHQVRWYKEVIEDIDQKFGLLRLLFARKILKVLKDSCF